MVQIEDFDYYVDEIGNIYNKDKMQLETQISVTGYNVINLYRDGRYWHKRCARLAGFAYLKDTYEEGFVINHKDLDKRNDKVSNLEWVSSSGNYKHSFDNQPENHKGNRQHSEDLIRDLCCLLEQGYQRKDIAKILGIENHLVKRVKNKQYWTWISDEYDFRVIGRGISIKTMYWVKHCMKNGWSDSRIMANNTSKLLTTDFLSKVHSGQYWSDIVVD